MVELAADAKVYVFPWEEGFDNNEYCKDFSSPGPRDEEMGESEAVLEEEAKEEVGGEAKVETATEPMPVVLTPAESTPVTDQPGPAEDVPPPSAE